MTTAEQVQRFIAAALDAAVGVEPPNDAEVGCIEAVEIDTSEPIIYVHFEDGTQWSLKIEAV